MPGARRQRVCNVGDRSIEHPGFVRCICVEAVEGIIFQWVRYENHAACAYFAFEHHRIAMAVSRDDFRFARFADKPGAAPRIASSVKPQLGPLREISEIARQHEPQ